jgi:hypothetical protein
MERLDIYELEYFFRWLAEHYEQTVVVAAVERWAAEKPARQQEMVAEFKRARQPVQQPAATPPLPCNA